MTYAKRFTWLFLLLCAVATPAQTQEFGVTQGALADLSQADSGMSAPNRIGRYVVGRRSFAFVDVERDNRLVVMDAWYPVDRQDAAGFEYSEYDLVFETLPSQVALQAPPVSADGPFPLLVFSHGNLGIRFQSFFLTEALASRGFIVVAPDHAGNTAQDLVFDTLEPFEVSAINRPIDMGFTIDKMLERNGGADDPFFGRIDPQRIGTFGHSFGGYTSLATASGIDGVPADPRVRAVAPFAPASGILTDAQLQAVTVPTLILGGTADITTPIDNQSTRPFELISAAQRVRIDIQDAGHQSFTDICTFTDLLIDAGVPMEFVAFLLGNADEGCAPELIPIEQAHAITRLFMIAFMKAHVAGDVAYARLLTPEFVERSGLPVDLFLPE